MMRITAFVVALFLAVEEARAERLVAEVGLVKDSLFSTIRSPGEA